MIVALIDNGSLEPAAHRNLRAVARALSARTETTIHAVSWKHSDRIAPDSLDGTPAWTLAPFVRAMVALGQRDFVFIPFFISPQGAIGSALRGDLEKLRRDSVSGFDFTFTEGLAAQGVLPAIVTERVRDVIAARRLARPSVIVVDHGGPSALSAILRDQIGESSRHVLAPEISQFAVASMEGAHPPLLADQLAAPGFARHDVIIAPLFLSPGRHAGPQGDIAQICHQTAADGTRCHFAELVGTHPAVVGALASALHDTLSTVHAQPSA